MDRYRETHAKVALTLAREHLANEQANRPLYDEFPHRAGDSDFNLGVFLHTCRSLADHLEQAMARVAELEAVTGGEVSA